MTFLRELYRFSRFHTIIGTTLSIVVLYFMAASLASSAQHISLLLTTLVACLGANIYIVGLNQITDIEIDKINKPWLPLASGAFSLPLGYAITFTGLLVAIAGAIFGGYYLLLTICISLFLGTIYSTPPLRLKQYYFWAAFCIIAIRGLVVNILIYLHFHHSIYDTSELPYLIYMLTATIFIYSIIIAWFKDMPDIQGDRAHAIKTLSVKLGVSRIKNLGIALLLFTYFILILAFAIYFTDSQRMVGILLHIGCAIYLLYQSKQVDISRIESIRKFYLSMWILFFAEYIGFGIIGII